MRADWVDLGRGVRLFTLEAGSDDGPLVVFLHGITAHAYVWLPVMEDLASEFRVVAVDQRGHGRSRVPAGAGFTAADFSDDVAELVEVLGSGPALVVGHSLGGRNALVTAARYPEMVAGIVSVEYSPFVEASVLENVEERMAAHPQTFTDESALDAHLRKRYPLLGEDALAIRARHGFRNDGGRWFPVVEQAVMVDVARGLFEDVRGAVEGVACPMVFLRGEASSFISPAAWRATGELIGAPALVSVKGADHFLHEEHPSEVAAAVRSITTPLSP